MKSTNQTKPPLSTRLVTPRTAYNHHGIYIGNGKVIHYSELVDDFNFTEGVIKETSIETFSNSNDFTLKIHSAPCFSGMYGTYCWIQNTPNPIQ
jgi:cell wall-associated NlpC family hydrolase